MSMRKRLSVTFCLFPKTFMFIIKQIMTQGFQKPANTVQELQLSHPGIIDADAFNEHFDLRCYQPTADLRPFVTHIWIQRLKQPLPAGHKLPVEIASGPNTYLFFTSQAAFIHNVAQCGFTYDPLTPGVIAGVKFEPAGFYPFLRRSLSGLNAAILPITDVFPKADAAFTEKLLAASNTDDDMVSMIEELLRDSQPEYHKNLRVVAEIVHAITTNASLRTVHATAQAFAMSERSLQLLFQTYVGVGVKWIIARRRLLEAIRRAQAHPDRTWVEVAAELGYSSQSHFSRDFKKVTGMSPSEYSR